MFSDCTLRPEKCIQHVTMHSAVRTRPSSESVGHTTTAPIFMICKGGWSFLYDITLLPTDANVHKFDRASENVFASWANISTPWPAQVWCQICNPTLLKFCSVAYDKQWIQAIVAMLVRLHSSFGWISHHPLKWRLCNPNVPQESGIIGRQLQSGFPTCLTIGPTPFPPIYSNTCCWLVLGLQNQRCK